MTVPSTISESSLELLEFLQRPSTYANHPQFVEVRETHISWVFLAGRYAFKLKKPVRFDFLDFSTCELRRRACESELRLNRRLSPSVYRAVVPVYRDRSSRLTLGGRTAIHCKEGQITKNQIGEVVDWLVKMRRLDDRYTLRERLLFGVDATRTGWDAEVRVVAGHLAQFYATQAPVTVRTAEYRESLLRHIEENEDELLQVAISDMERDAVQLIHSAQKRFLVVHQDVVDNRVRDGRIVDGHGDLRPEHIYLYSRPVVIDCVEFNAEYRRNDIVDELAFLAMECDGLGDRNVGPMLFDAYDRASGDEALPSLIAFYKSYRACVRAKIAVIRSQQQDSSLAAASLRAEHQYLDLAKSYLRDMGSRIVMIIGGLMGSGKSTLAQQIGQLFAAEVISSDIVRLGDAAAIDANGYQKQQTRVELESEFGAGKYSIESRMRTYRSMIRVAADAFARNDMIVLDATFSNTSMRQLAAELAESFDARLVQIECVCPRGVAMSRIADRNLAGSAASQARPEFYDRQAAASEPPLPTVPLVKIDTTLAIGRQEAIVLEQLQSVVAQTQAKT